MTGTESTRVALRRAMLHTYLGRPPRGHVFVDLAVAGLLEGWDGPAVVALAPTRLLQRQ